MEIAAYAGWVGCSLLSVYTFARCIVRMDARYGIRTSTIGAAFSDAGAGFLTAVLFIMGPIGLIGCAGAVWVFERGER